MQNVTIVLMTHKVKLPVFKNQLHKSLRNEDSLQYFLAIINWTRRNRPMDSDVVDAERCSTRTRENCPKTGARHAKF